MTQSPPLVRPIDRLGRLVIPIEARRQFGWLPGSSIGIHMIPNGVALFDDALACLVCHERPQGDDWMPFRRPGSYLFQTKNQVQSVSDDRVICGPCARQLSERVMERIAEAEPAR